MSTDIVERFGERIKALRLAKGATQIDLAERVGIEQSYLSLLENGKQEPCLRVIEMLATGLETSLSKLFKDL
jgi:transcriptional regulator with XRE-family HTH domain